MEPVYRARYSYLITYFENKGFDMQAFIAKHKCENVVVARETCPKTQRIHYHMYCESYSRACDMVIDIKSKGDLKWIKNTDDIIYVIQYVIKNSNIVFTNLGF